MAPLRAAFLGVLSLFVHRRAVADYIFDSIFLDGICETPIEVAATYVGSGGCVQTGPSASSSVSCLSSSSLLLKDYSSPDCSGLAASTTTESLPTGCVVDRFASTSVCVSGSYSPPGPQSTLSTFVYSGGFEGGATCAAAAAQPPRTLQEVVSVINVGVCFPFPSRGASYLFSCDASTAVEHISNTTTCDSEYRTVPTPLGCYPQPDGGIAIATCGGSAAAAPSPSSAGAIAGGVVGGVAVAGLIAAAVILYRRRAAQSAPSLLLESMDVAYTSSPAPMDEESAPQANSVFAYEENADQSQTNHFA